MPQSADKVLDHNELFKQPEYQDLMARKKAFEEAPCADKVKETEAWTKSWEYREINFKREALTVNPAKACQPLGAVLCASGFEGTLPYVHGSQGCVAYFRSHFNRHFKEPSSCVSDSMTEDAAVFGGMNNMVDGLANAYALYKPKMIAVSTTCMAEVIGDDLDAFIKTAKQKGSIPEEFRVPFAHTPSFVGSHITGYDNMSDCLRKISALLVQRGAPADLLDRAEALIAREEAKAWARLESYKPRLQGKRVLLFTGGVKSWSVVSALQEVGMEIVGTSMRKTTMNDREKVKEIMGTDAHMFDSLPPREMYQLLKDAKADIMLSGGRSQFVALKAKTPWVEINQERHHALAGYEGIVALVEEIDKALYNPIWAQVREPAPWEKPNWGWEEEAL